MADISADTASAGVTITDPALRRQLAYAQFEYVTVTFTAANTDTLITYQQLTPENPETVRWLDITPGSVYNSPTDSVATVYRSGHPDRQAFGPNYLQLRSTVAGYTTRLLLFLERS